MATNRFRACRCLATLTLLALFAADANGEYPPPAECEPGIATNASLVIHEVDRLASRFSLRRTLQQVVSTSAVTTSSPEALLQSMLDSFAAQSFDNAGRKIPVVERPEASLDAAKLLDPGSPDGMIPTGLFNRFDLAPAAGDHCGEYRITYAKKQSGTPGKFLLIFEGVLRNPKPAEGLAACKPVTDFWVGLSKEPDPDKRVQSAEAFYYAGLGGGFGPVVSARNYGADGLGQVRSNLFITPGQWSLREHAVDPLDARFVAATVKTNPLVELFRPAATLPPSFTAADQRQFRDDFRGEPLCALLRPDRADPKATPDDVINGIGMRIEDQWNDFESISHPAPPGPDDPNAGTDAPFVTDLTSRLGSLNSPITAEQALNRAGAMTCGGCHDFSNGKDLGHGTTWPPSLRFVHIDEAGQLSDALTKSLLPKRAEYLEHFFCQGTPPPIAQAPCDPLPAAPQRAAAAPLAELLKRVDEARATALPQLQAAPTADAARQQRAQLTERVRAVREAERALPGAFVPVRRTH